MNKCVLITGAEKNSGYGIARKFLKEGWSVVLTSRDEGKVQEVAASLEKEFNISCYGFGYKPLEAITDTDVLFEKIEKAGIELDALVCVAADLGRWMDPLTVDGQDWANVLHTNVVGYFMPARAAVRQMIRTGKAKGATIVFTGSINYINALPERSAYVASKGAISSMTKALALDFAKYGVRVNCIAPGAILTDRYDGLDEEEFERRRSAIPLNEFSTKETMGENVYFLASESSFPMTGSVMIVDGGSTSIVPGAF
jgi:NAD(P)-dependent dehydrogenase (short-subunit alcohol dehydrogenase family)